MTWRHLDNVDYNTIPVYVRAGSVLPLRKGEAMTTAQNAKLLFEIRIPPDAQGKASGELYVDDGVSLEPQDVSDLKFAYDGGKLRISGSCGPLSVSAAL